MTTKMPRHLVVTSRRPFGKRLSMMSGNTSSDVAAAVLNVMLSNVYVVQQPSLDIFSCAGHRSKQVSRFCSGQVMAVSLVVGVGDVVQGSFKEIMVLWVDANEDVGGIISLNRLSYHSCSQRGHGGCDEPMHVDGIWKHLLNVVMHRTKKTDKRGFISSRPRPTCTIIISLQGLMLAVVCFTSKTLPAMQLPVANNNTQPSRAFSIVLQGDTRETDYRTF